MSETRTRRPRRPNCTDPTHTARGRKGVCLTCKAAWQRDWQERRRAKRWQEKGLPLTVPAGESPRSSAAKAAWATRRQRYGQSGCTEAGLQRKADVSRALLQGKRSEFCKRGHRFTPDNVLMMGGYRTCRTCHRNNMRARRGRLRLEANRPAWVEVEGVRLSVEVHDAVCLKDGRVLWTRMLDAHPDRGGTQKKFESARRQWDRWLAKETAWYAAAGLSLPAGLKRRSDERQAA